MGMRIAHGLVACLLAGCGTEPNPADMRGTWVLTFPNLFVLSYGFNCTSLSGTVLEVTQEGDQISAPFEQGLLMCASNPFDSITVPFAQGRLDGTLDGDHLDVGFEGAEGRFTGTVDGGSASGDVDYTDPNYDVAISGTWAATRRTPTGAMSVTFSTTSMAGLLLPTLFVTVDGNATQSAPTNGTMTFTRLTGGRHRILVATGTAQSCTITGGPTGALTGVNPNDQFVDIVESQAPLVFAYVVGCA